MTSTETSGQHRLLSLSLGAKSTDLPTLNENLVNGLPSAVLSTFQAKNLLTGPTNGSEGASPTRRVTVIVSVASGARLAAQFCDEIISRLPFAKSRDQRVVVSFDRTTSSESITDFCRQKYIPSANKGEQQDIVLLSGDGGVVDIVNAFYASAPSPTYKRPNLYILPFGTGNALANSYNCCNDNTWGLSALLRGTARPLPSIRIKFSPGSRLLVPETLQEQPLPKDTHGEPVLYAAVVCSWGLHASLVCDSDTAEYRKFGAERFLMAAKALVYGTDATNPETSSEQSTSDPYKATYHGRVSFRSTGADAWTTLDRDRHSYILATLVSNLEKTFTISPASKSLDGKLRLVDIPPVDGDYFMSIAGGAYDGGKHIGMEHVGYREIQGLKIEFEDSGPRGRIVCVDGKIVRVEAGGWIQVETVEESLIDIVHWPEESS